MIFVKGDELKVGMRLAKPIYSKDGVLLYERDSKLSQQGIDSIDNFGLIGIFVLEPAEPVPPMTRDDLKFERFQTMTVFSIQEELNKIIQTKRSHKIQIIAANIIKNYGNRNSKINFVQNLRSQDDYVYKHSLNVSILCAMISHAMNIRLNEQLDAVITAVIHDIGRVMLNPTEQVDAELMEALAYARGIEIIEHAFANNPTIKRICMQTHKAIEDCKKGKQTDQSVMVAAKILLVAETYDRMTAMHLGGDPASEVAAMRLLFDHPECYEKQVVKGLLDSINILNPGACIELNNGEKSVVLVSNPKDILRPMILNFQDNMIIDLSNQMMYGDLHIKDIMKTMDNRYVMDMEILKQRGIRVNGWHGGEEEEVEEYVPGQ
ncbi:MAG: phosphohydrolase [Lachnospiraceae bacterium]